jgi:hypothetical protein
MQFHLEKQTNTKKIPRWFAKFILRQTQKKQNIQQIFFTLLENTCIKMADIALKS